MNADAKYILGTEGKPDYIVVAEKGELRLGVKAFSGPGPNATIMLAMRLRAQRIDAKKADNEKMFGEVFPLPFTKLSTKRASVEVVQFVNRSHFQFAEVIEQADAARFAVQAYDYLVQSGIVVDITEADFREHVHKQWFDEELALINTEDTKLLLSGFAVIDDFFDEMKNSGLQISQKGTTVKGVTAAWPKPSKAKKKPRKKAIKGKAPSEVGTDNVVQLPVKKSKKKPTKKK